MTPWLLLFIILFADDIVLLAKTRKYLHRLLTVVLQYFEDHKLTISTKKTKLMCSSNDDGEISFMGETTAHPLTISLVSSFKYLGVTFNSQPYRLFSDYNASVIAKCDSYCHSILSLS